MQKLILFRHAKAEGRAASGDDFDRDLTDRGRRDARLVGEALARLGHTPDLALVSAARRTRSTYEALSSALSIGEARFEDLLYGAPAVSLLSAAERAAHPGCVMVVAHNPGLHDAVLHLISFGTGEARSLSEVRYAFPTSTAAVFRMDGEVPHLETCLFARDLGGGGGE